MTVWMVEGDLPNRCKLNSKVNVHHFLIVLSITFVASMEEDADFGKKNRKKPVRSLEQMSLLASHIRSVFADEKSSFHRKEHHTYYSETWRRLGDVLRLLYCAWHRVTWMCAGHNDISRLSGYSGAEFTAQCHKALPQSQIMSPPTG